jgi:hypothetical protein
MTGAAPLLSFSAVLWLKGLLTAAMLVLLYRRYRQGGASGASSAELSFAARAVIVAAILLSAVVFHNLGGVRGGTFVHYGETFHYYLGSKYFEELGYYELYNAVIAADAEQENALAGIPFFTDLHTYQNARRETALAESDRVRGLFSNERWSTFKQEVAFFKRATGMPHSPGLRFLVTDHGYNASPTSAFTFDIGLIIPLDQTTERTINCMEGATD